MRTGGGGLPVGFPQQAGRRRGRVPADVPGLRLGVCGQLHELSLFSKASLPDGGDGRDFQ